MATDQQRRRWCRWVFAGVAAAVVVQVVALAFTGGALEVVLVFGPWLIAPPVLVATVPSPRTAPVPRRDQPFPMLVAPFVPAVTYLVPLAWIVLHAEMSPWLAIIAVAVAAVLALAAAAVIFWLRLRRARRRAVRPVRVIELRRVSR